MALLKEAWQKKLAEYEAIKIYNIKYHKGKDFVMTYKNKKGQDKKVMLFHDGFKRKMENLFFDSTPYDTT